MKRRDFLKVTGIGAAGAATMAAPAIAQSMPEIKWRLAASWPKSLDTLWGGVEHHGQARCRSHRQQVSNSGFCRRRNRAGAAGPRCRAKRHRRDGAYGLLLLLRQGSDLCIRYGGAVRAQPAYQPGLVHARRWQGPAQPVLQELQRHVVSGRQYRVPDGWLVPQGDQYCRRSEGAQNAHRRLCRRA